ncbi:MULTISPECIES: Gfo/Idh/MocA family oxidoreductase [unclassified Chelatococcus]|uniref:Gfo/Idh/MocA family protein n=1 Tax=unclassified Chelatococcus TaxID=2638111 RepID=UPI001BCB3EE6|nr:MULTISPECIES: Gfo/Idh/MocA family oxidoreductase [unclassified Chelatococcus]CAH1648789.1 Myo-inositol 2-dehydrogenase/D-chiro-inositol 1-dehydrogenase [Hyphomicrobiales bacterium]MBS7741867.1 Gfo/Idh/MocA family oxidoreductase [Chelatococcus sp. HY11]MBX3541335.1 Gfo/Idh/MocA family oxidoreductase [Chelatococcus sp.]MCO5074771.1 Gfo/Idh/MocA family oxidoreductase [Chelatococcus sp.]CAH1691409.1 Myo-inositol 2-dehydrogenase/D-chiro-inositol 1-dehydrogenase [Hyphomicrobiales bacterium]
MTSPLRIGWIGCGTHANEMLLPQLTRHDVVIEALCDTSRERLAATGRRYGVAPENQLTDWRVLLARDDIDALGLAVGPQLHYDIGLAAIDRGLPVFIEKPPAPTAAQAQELADAAKARGVPVVLGFMKRYSTANRIAANVIHSAEFGVTASFLGQYMTAPTYFAKDVDYTGFYLHHCVHYFDLVPHLMGGVADISARRHEIEPGKLLLHVDFLFANGGIGTLVMGTHQSRGTPMEWWQVMGDHRRVEVRNVHEVRYFRHPPFKVSKLDASLVDSEDTLVWEPNLTAAANEDHKGYHAILGEFVRAARGEQVSFPNAADGARAMALLEKAIG